MNEHDHIWCECGHCSCFHRTVGCNHCKCRRFIQQNEDNLYLSDPLALAVLFHVTYEKLAPNTGYETRKETKVFNPESPNGKLMIATCAEIQKAIRQDGE